MGGIEFIDPEEAEIAASPVKPEPVSRKWATPAITTANLAIYSSILIAAVIAGGSSFFNVYRSSLAIMTSDAPTGYKYSVDGWGRENFKFFNFGDSGSLPPAPIPASESF